MHDMCACMNHEVHACVDCICIHAHWMHAWHEAWDGACMTNMNTWSALMAWLLDCMHACRHEKQACMAWSSACISWGLPKSPRNHIESCRVTCKWHVWGLALKTTTRCLSHYRRLWPKKTLDEVAEQQEKDVSCYWVEAGSNQKNLEHFFLEGPHSSRKLWNEQKLRGTLFCVPKGGSGI